MSCVCFGCVLFYVSGMSVCVYMVFVVMLARRGVSVVVGMGVGVDVG